MRFSKKFGTYGEWLNAIEARLIPQPKYFFRIVKYLIKRPEATLSEARGHKPKSGQVEPQVQATVELAQPPEPVVEVTPENSYRYTLGTNISDKDLPLSFTGFFFSDGEFSYGEELTCYRNFAKFVDDIIGKRYKGRNYTLDDDVLTGWGGVLREEHNAVVDHVRHGSYRCEFKVREVVRYTEVGEWI